MQELRSCLGSLLKNKIKSQLINLDLYKIELILTIELHNDSSEGGSHLVEIIVSSQKEV